MVPIIQDIFWKTVDAILPPRCLVSGAVVDRQDMVAPDVWSQLNFISPPLCVTCGYPFDFTTEGENMCGPCLQEKPPYDSARHVFSYDDASSDIILRFKYADQTHGTQTLANWMQRAAADFLPQADIIVPVPLHARRLLMRRYNQAALLAKALARRHGKDCLTQALRRTRVTAVQGKKGFRERHRNVKNAFAVTPRHEAALKDKTVLLVDDVYTSGATIRECTRVLKEAGVRAVHVVTLARVVRPVWQD